MLRVLGDESIVSAHYPSSEGAKICLVRPLLSPTDFNGYPLNLLILAAALSRAGHRVEICDYDFLKETDSSWAAPGFAKRAATDILAKRPQFVGITALCSNYVIALDLAAEIKAGSRHLHITLGGPHVSLCARETLERHDYIDSAVVGEGEVSYPELINCLQHGGDLGKVLGIAYRTGNAIAVTPPRQLLPDLNLSPQPAYELVDVRKYIEAASDNYLELYAGSGCPFTCTFCSTSIVWKRKYRTMSAERIVGEMQVLSSRYGATAFNLIHDNLTTDKQFVAKIASLIVERGLRVRWGFSSRIDTIDSATIRTVTAAGCDYIFFGIESGSAKIQRTMRKRLKLERIREVIEECIDNGIAPTTSFILGFPDEDSDDIASTVRLAFRCRVLGARRSFINLLSAYTGTPVMEEMADRLTFSRETANSTMVSFLEEKHYDQIEADRFIFANYYSLDYSESTLDAGGYLDLVDFYTVCLFRYRYTVSFLINDLGIDPVAFFSRLQSRIRALSVAERNSLGLSLSYEDIEWCVEPAHVCAVKALLLFDQALWMAGTSMLDGLIFSGPVKLSRQGHRKEIVSDGAAHHYLLKCIDNEVRVTELQQAHSELYRLQGMYALSCQTQSVMEGVAH
jgi:radical SAM superfamily enzyme YgiQ (UPF0313 family)